MTDESPDIQPEPKPDAPDAEESSGDESVDELLDRASSLATEMATEIGEPSPEQRATQSEESLTDLNDLASSLDKELDQMDKLTKEVGDQVGGGEANDSTAADEVAAQPAGSDETPSLADGAEAALSEAAAALDQSLSEEINADLDPEAPPSADEPAAGVSHPAVADDLTAPPVDPYDDDLTAPPADPYDDDLTSPPPEAPEPAGEAAKSEKDTAEPEAPVEGDSPGEKGKRASILGLVSGLARIPVGLSCTLLDIADRPFGRVSPRVRGWIGIVALATLGTAGAVLLISML